MPQTQKKNYLQKTLGQLESMFLLLGVTLQDLRHEMEHEYDLKTLDESETTPPAETETLEKQPTLSKNPINQFKQ